MRVRLAVIVLNWNGADDTIACLRSLRASTVPAYLIVIDNGSTDDSVGRITASGLADEVIQTALNLGYAEGNNVGIRLALDRGFEAIGVLNNDTIVAPDALKLVLDDLPVLEHRAVSPDIRYLNRPADSWFAGGVVDRGWPRHLQPAELPRDRQGLRRSECLSGCCIVARSETWEAVGLFDPTYFLIFEDSDWSMRAVRCGVSLYVIKESTIYHRVSSSFGEGPASLLGGYYYVRNGLRFEARYFASQLPRFAFRWLIRPVPALARRGRIGELMFRWFGAVAFAMGRSGPAPRILVQLATRLNP